MGFVKPTITDFKQFFARDFPYGTDPNTSVLDSDILKAQMEADVNFNECLWDTQSSFSIAYELLTAHNLVMDLRSSSQGIAGQYEWLQSSKSVGSVSESLSIPQRILDNPEMSMLSKTNYGARYLMMMLPQMAGVMFTVPGSTRP